MPKQLKAKRDGNESSETGYLATCAFGDLWSINSDIHQLANTRK